MATVMSTKMTRGGQTTVPKEIRHELGIPDDGRVYWHCDGGRAYVTAQPYPPNAVLSKEQFWDGIAASEANVSAGRTRHAGATSDDLRTRYGLA